MTEISKKKKTPIRKISSAIGYIVFAMVFVCLLTVVAQLAMHKEPSLFGYRLYTVQTPSMQPTIMQGDVLICKDTDIHYKYKKEDVITFIAPDGFSSSAMVGKNITHRIEKAPFLDDDGIWYVTTKGDNNALADNVNIPLKNIKGIVVGNSHAVRGLVNFIGKWYGFVLVIVLPLMAVLIYQIVILIRAKSQVSKEKIEKERQTEIDTAIAEMKMEILQTSTKNNLDIEKTNESKVERKDGTQEQR